VSLCTVGGGGDRKLRSLQLGGEKEGHQKFRAERRSSQPTPSNDHFAIQFNRQRLLGVVDDKLKWVAEGVTLVQVSG
jgi:hypothetical protein